MCRYLVAEDDHSVYVAFVGTKHMQDLLIDLNYWQQPLSPGQSDSLLVHQGFVSRARQIPAEQFYQQALAKRKHLVFCGEWPDCFVR